MKNSIPSFLLDRPSSDGITGAKGRLKIPFVDKGIHHLADVIKTGYLQSETSSKDFFFQKIDARIKVLFLLFFVILVSLKKEPGSEALIGLFVFILTSVSHLSVFTLYKRVLFWTFIFGVLIALPSAFNVITKGELIFPIIRFSESHRLWIYQIPQEIGITGEGILIFMILSLRVMNSLAISFFVLYTTPLPEIIKALKIFKVPDSFLMIVTLSYKYIFILAKIAEEMYLAKKSRLIGQVTPAEARKWIAGRMLFLFIKSRKRCEEIFKAMLARGFSGDINIYRVKKLHARDWTAGVIFFSVGILFLCI